MYINVCVFSAIYTSILYDIQWDCRRIAFSDAGRPDRNDSYIIIIIILIAICYYHYYHYHCYGIGVMAGQAEKRLPSERKRYYDDIITAENKLPGRGIF